MTREECIKKLESLEKGYIEEAKQFTIDLFDSKINAICVEEYSCNEHEDLGAIVYYCDTLLAIMKEDIIDKFIVSRIKYILEKRLKTICDEG